MQMNITNARFTDEAQTQIAVEFDGVELNVPAVEGNRHYQMILDQGVSVAAYVAPTPEPTTVLAPLAFLERFTLAERTAIRTAAANDNALADWMDLLRTAQEIDLASARTIGGLQALVDAGLLTTTRRDEILTP